MEKNLIEKNIKIGLKKSYENKQGLGMMYPTRFKKGGLLERIMKKFPGNSEAKFGKSE